LLRGKSKIFFSSPVCTVQKSAAVGSASVAHKFPRVKIGLEDCDFICLELARKGWCGGNPDTISNMRTDWVMKIWKHEDFRSEYEQEYNKLNQ
jgi:hypothetical protein